ncbi:MAG TPA: hemerythrin domain-containing protein [Rhodocyclaceae bacterium]
MTFAPWKTEYELKHATMDDTHREFIDWLNRLDSTPDEGFAAALDEFIAHTIEHFEQENRWMRDSAFPPVNCHKGEHDEVLEVVRNVRAKVGTGDMDIGRRLVQELLPWFENHAGNMDAALAMWINGIGFDTSAKAKPKGDNA